MWIEKSEQGRGGEGRGAGGQLSYKGVLRGRENAASLDPIIIMC